MSIKAGCDGERVGHSMSSALRSVAWFIVAIVVLVVISVFIHFLLRIALLVALLAVAYYLYARAADMRRRKRRS